MEALIKSDEIKAKPQLENINGFNTFCNETVSLNNDTVLTQENDKLVNALPSIKHNTTYHLQSFGKWSLHHMVLHLIDVIGPAHLWGTSYAICQKSMQALFNRNKTGDILSISFLLDPEVRKKSANAFQFLLGITDKIGLKPNHAKCTVLQNKHNSATIISSSNWSVNRRVEVYCIDTNPSTAEFYSKLIEELILTHPLTAYGV